MKPPRTIGLVLAGALALALAPAARADGDGGRGQGSALRSQWGQFIGADVCRRGAGGAAGLVDSAQIYGSARTGARAGRTHDGTGRLRPTASGGGEPEGLVALRTLFLREHNYLALRVGRLLPSLDDEGRYQAARALVEAEVQLVTAREWIPLLRSGDPGAPALADDLCHASTQATRAPRRGKLDIEPVLRRLASRPAEPVPAATLVAVLEHQLAALRDSARAYQRALPPVLKAWVERQTLAKVIRRNTGMGREIQPNVFVVRRGTAPGLAGS
jgi:hypothetical protein